MPLQKFDAKRDCYSRLGGSEKASKREVDLAYRSKARKQHRDGGGTEKERKLFNEAGAILSDPEPRRAYDTQRRPPHVQRNPTQEFDPYAASRAGTLKIPVANADLAGLLMG